MKSATLNLALAIASVLCALPVSAQWTQQGAKLVGTGFVGFPTQGFSVSISADGNTAIVGGDGDSSSMGATWVFTRTAGAWTQQGSKLVGTGAANVASQGQSAALSADGNTAIVGGPADNAGKGAVWVFTRSAGVWTQQGSKLVGTGASGAGGASQGSSVALSADGNTALVGGSNDASFVGAAWVFTRSAGVWTQQGTKLVAYDAVGAAHQGSSVCLSGDGNTAIVGGWADNGGAGATWVFTRSAGVWTQQGNKLAGTGTAGHIAPNQGTSVSLSADGNTAIEGGYEDNGGMGAAWVFTRSAGVWTQQGSKLVGTGTAGPALQGISVSLSADGNTAIEGGRGDNTSAGAAWVFTRSAGVWTQQGNKLVGTGAVGIAQQGYSVSLSADGNTAIVGGDYDNGTLGAAWVFTNGVTGVRDVEASSPGSVVLQQNFPNPFNPSTRIGYVVPFRSQVTLRVFNTLGQKVAELVNAEKEPGSYEVTFNANGLASGVYVYRIQAGSFVETKKLVLLR